MTEFFYSYMVQLLYLIYKDQRWLVDIFMIEDDNV